LPPADNGHAVHTALFGVGTNCAVCHSNNTHADGWVDIGISPTYNAKGLTAAENPNGTASCVNVSCHGGQTTPLWNASLNVDTQCAACHVRGSSAGSPQFNSFYSGEHRKHVEDKGYACTACHNTTKLAVNHFANLATTNMEGPASGTIGGGTTSVTTYNTNRTCVACHGTSKGSW
jgi:predicted CxxxxCH...CXXCH cytochrome family protein